MDFDKLVSQDSQITDIHKFLFLLSSPLLSFLSLLFSYGKPNHNQRILNVEPQKTVLDASTICSHHPKIFYQFLSVVYNSIATTKNHFLNLLAIGYSWSVFALLIFLFLNFDSWRILLAMHTFVHCAYEVDKP